MSWVFLVILYSVIKGIREVLKKKSLQNTPIYHFFDNIEIPVCPLADDYTSRGEPEYFYYFFADGTVLCSCPDCNEAD